MSFRKYCNMISWIKSTFPPSLVDSSQKSMNIECIIPTKVYLFWKPGLFLRYFIWSMKDARNVVSSDLMRFCSMLEVAWVDARSRTVATSSRQRSKNLET